MVNDNFYKTWTQPTYSSSDITMDAIKEADKRLRELMPTDVPDVYVTTTECYELIRKEIQADSPQPTMQSLPACFGIPIEHYPTLQEAFSRAMELKNDGKKVALIGK